MGNTAASNRHPTSPVLHDLPSDLEKAENAHDEERIKGVPNELRGGSIIIDGDENTETRANEFYEDEIREQVETYENFRRNDNEKQFVNEFYKDFIGVGFVFYTKDNKIASQQAVVENMMQKFLDYSGQRKHSSDLEKVENAHDEEDIEKTSKA